ncbi:hypothetical protein [Lamprocystis purpurea]|jgi:hypothetical protein|uniref:hypothetical protein n=1 Tax=Lamprocystis purpurea TaxID=61598 RepID=UPI00035C0A77|nr:hypothetical protein [Lamprocystis purpurea]
MTTPNRAPGASLPQSEIDRNALARRVFDAAICYPNFDLCDGLDNWLSLIEGIAGYLAITSTGQDPLEAETSPEERGAMGEVIQRAARVARALADEVAVPARQARTAAIRAQYGIEDAA